MILGCIAFSILIQSNSSAEVIQIFSGPEGGKIQALAINPVNTNTLYAGTGGGGVFKSTDGGDTWDDVNTGLTGFFVQCLAINTNTPSTLYAGTLGGGAFKSTNGGDTWIAFNTGLINLNVQVHGAGLEGF